MEKTAKNVILNLLYYVETYGFVLNGGRVYYTTRTQPPFLTLMVKEYVRFTNDTAFLRRCLPLLDKEYQFWVTNRSVRVRQKYDLFQYRTNMAYERPESFWEDHQTADEAVNLAGRNRAEVFVDISSAAESGWDFSSRWLAYSGPHSLKLYSIRTTKIVPVCLNSILYKVTNQLCEFHNQTGNIEQARYYANESRRIMNAVMAVFWDSSQASWFDYDIEEDALHYKMYASNYYPLWAKCHNLSDNEMENVINRLRQDEYVFISGGFPTSSVGSGQQWDFPNAWPPLQDIMIEGLLNQNSNEAKKMAMNLLENWITNSYCTLQSKDAMFEKYSAARFGFGKGGEYYVQAGFGWTNGVILKYLTKFGSSLVSSNAICGADQ